MWNKCYCYRFSLESVVHVGGWAHKHPNEVGRGDTYLFSLKGVHVGWCGVCVCGCVCVRVCVCGGVFVVVYNLMDEHNLGSPINFLWRSFLTGNTTGVTKLNKLLKIQ